jgi:hypothetical protein
LIHGVCAGKILLRDIIRIFYRFSFAWYGSMIMWRLCAT